MAISKIETASLDTGLVAPTATALTTASGSAPSYSARAWVNFDGTGTPAIRASGNVSSITDNGTGDYTVNFTTAMPDTNFSVVGSSNESATTFTGGQRVANCCIPSASSARVAITFQNGGVGDQPIICVAIFR
jgi:hypothetical protein